MRMLRWTMTFLCAIMITLSGIIWYQGVIVVDYTNQQAVAIHYMGHRMYYLEVQCACPSDMCVCPISARALAPLVGYCICCSLHISLIQYASLEHTVSLLYLLPLLQLLMLSLLLSRIRPFLW
jgi:hypothetical protein